jgi:hypothetical protein
MVTWEVMSLRVCATLTVSGAVSSTIRTLNQMMIDRRGN